MHSPNTWRNSPSDFASKLAIPSIQVRISRWSRTAFYLLSSDSVMKICGFTIAEDLHQKKRQSTKNHTLNVIRKTNQSHKVICETIGNPPHENLIAGIVVEQYLLGKNFNEICNLSAHTQQKHPVRPIEWQLCSATMHTRLTHQMKRLLSVRRLLLTTTI